MNNQAGDDYNHAGGGPEDADELSGCNYQGYEFGANYPDSCCIEGYLWDADSCDEPGGPLTQGGEIPCPQCNHDTWLEYRREDIEENGYDAGLVGEDDPPYQLHNLKHPQDLDTMVKWWREGYERGQQAAKEGTP